MHRRGGTAPGETRANTEFKPKVITEILRAMIVAALQYNQDACILEQSGFLLSRS